ncbi:MAG: hypothetical protein PHT48_09950 [Dechloromonas sp.]|nr:hypothetical protein [Dechloromonas sp.]
MTTDLDFSATAAPEANIKRILEWLAMAHGRNGSDDIEEVLKHIIVLRQTPIPCGQRIKLLDLIYAHVERVVKAELPRLNKVSLPISRKLRLKVRQLLDLLERLTQDYFNSLAAIFDPQTSEAGSLAQVSLRRAMLSIIWQIRIFHLVASPVRPMLWQQLHATYRNARRFGIADLPGPRDTPSIQRLYSDGLLAAIAQPASFCAEELSFISDYIEYCTPDVPFSEAPISPTESTFWIDQDRDFPAHALVRRGPSGECRPLYFNCADVATQALQHLGQLQRGTSAASLHLPVFAESHTGQGILRRLARLWGEPAKRKFSRRHQSYRAHLCVGLDTLWHLLKAPNAEADASEWMVTNESPDGYALMHMSGNTRELRVGDIVALKPMDKVASTESGWHVCIIRWAISENPEHVEIGLQQIASRAISAHIAQPYELQNSNQVMALILPETPPLRTSQSLVVHSGLLKEHTRRIIVLVEQDNLEIREVQATRMDEQTSAIEIFSLEPDELI